MTKKGPISRMRAKSRVSKALRAAKKATKAYKKYAHSEKTIEEAGAHDTMHTDFHVITLKKGKRYEKNAGKWRYVHQAQQVVKSTDGLQGQCELAPMLTVGDQLLSTTGPITTSLATIGQWGNSPFELNPYRKITGSSILTAGTSYANDYIHLTSSNIEITLSNLSSKIPVEIDFYFMLAQCNSEFSPIQIWTQTVSNEAMGQAVAHGISNGVGVGQVTGYDEIGGYTSANKNSGEYFRFNYSGLGPVTTYSTYGITPMTHATFRKYWKPVFRKNIIIEPGDSKKQKFKVHYHRTFSYNQLQQLVSQSINCLKGVTIIPFMIIRGGPQYVGGDTKVMTWSTAEVGVISNYRYDFETCAAKEARLEFSRNQTTFYSSGNADNTVAGKAKWTDVVDDVVDIANTLLA